MPLGEKYQTFEGACNRQFADEGYLRARRDQMLERGHFELAEAYHKAMWEVIVRREVGNG